MQWRSGLIAACLMALSWGCGSSVSVDGGAGGTGTGGTTSGAGGTTSGAGGTTSGAGGAAGGGSPCLCAATDACYEDACLPRKVVALLVWQVDDEGVAFLDTSTWSGVQNVASTSSVLQADGDCRLLGLGDVESKPTYTPESLDVGTVTVQLESASPLAFPPLEGGHTSLQSSGFPDFDLSFDPSGGQSLVVAFSGGDDLPPTQIVMTTSGPLEPNATLPFVPGEPWTIGWNAAEPPTTLTLTGDGSIQLECDLEGGAVTIPASLTAALSPTTATLTGSVDRREALEPTEASNGVELRRTMWRRSFFDVAVGL